MLDVKPWVYGKLAASSALVAVLGSVDRIEFFYPTDPTNLPKLTYAETNQPSAAYYDDASKGAESSIEIHVWTAVNVSTSAISKIVDTIMHGLLFNTDFSGDFQEPETRINHRVLRYRRLLTALDLV
jgi:hypothetical protein